MNTFKQVCCVGFLGLAVGSGPLVAAQPGAMTRGAVPFATYDQDGDGRISEAEFKGVREVRGERISDRASKGYAMRNLGKAPTFAEIDTNGDREIGPAEFAGRQQSRP